MCNAGDVQYGKKILKAAHFMAFSVLVAMATGNKRYGDIENHKKINNTYYFIKIYKNGVQNPQSKKKRLYLCKYY